MIVLTSNGLSSDKLLNTMQGYIKSGRAALVVTADNEYKEKNYHVERLTIELQALGLIVDCFDFDVLKRGDELRFLLFHHLGHSSLQNGNFEISMFSCLFLKYKSSLFKKVFSYSAFMLT